MLNGEASLGSRGVLSSKRLLRAKRDSLGNDDGIGIAEESLPLHVWAILSNGQSRAVRTRAVPSWIGIQQKCSLEGHSRAAM